MSELRWVTVCGGEGCGYCKGCEVERLEAEIAEFKRRLPDDYLTQLEFARTEHAALIAENDRLRAVYEASMDDNIKLRKAIMTLVEDDE
jgi:hypothetical protein